MNNRQRPFNEQLLKEEYGFLGGVVFADMCSVVMPPVRVQQAYGSFMDEYVRGFGKGLIGQARGHVEDARERVAELIGARSHEIAFTKNTCEGISLIANGYPLSPGDNVIIAAQEHPSNALPWIHAQRRGVAVRVIEDTGAHPSVDDFLALVDDQTRMIAVSAAQFGTGYVIDLKQLGAECRARNIVFVVDGIQALGRIPIDVNGMNIDVLAAGGNKGLLGTLGAGFVYCSDRIVSVIEPSYAGYQSVVNETPPPAPMRQFDTVNWHPTAQRFEAGNLNYNGILALERGVSLLLEVGVEHIASWVAQLEAQLRNELAQLPLDVIDIAQPEHRCGTVCIRYPAERDDDLLNILEARQIFATVRGGWLRLSLGLYNTREDIERIARALETFSQNRT